MRYARHVVRPNLAVVGVQKVEASPALPRIDCMAADVVNEKACATQPAYIAQVALQSSFPLLRRQYAPANGVAASAENARCPLFGPLLRG